MVVEGYCGAGRHLKDSHFKLGVRMDPQESDGTLQKVQGDYWDAVLALGRAAFGVLSSPHTNFM